MEMTVSTVLLGVGFFMLVKGADFFVDGASGIAQRFGIPQLVIGLTIVAMGTSAPEAAVSITAALKGNADITMGNVVGSNILNILIILGISAAAAPLVVARSTIFAEIPFMTAVTFVLLAMGMGGSVGFMEGIALMFLFLLYLGYLFFMAKRKKEIPYDMSVSAKGIKERKLWQSGAEAAAGLALIIAGSHTAVNAAGTLARLFGMSERLIGLTVVALGTSLPELFTSVAASRKGNADIAIGNIVGSNIFNILFVAGASALIIPVPFSADFYPDTLAAAASGILLFLLTVKKHRLCRWGGVALLAAYGLYFALIALP